MRVVSALRTDEYLDPEQLGLRVIGEAADRRARNHMHVLISRANKALRPIGQRIENKYAVGYRLAPTEGATS